ncbi:MAG: hypothetical protein K1X75_10730 [Leptospirales bacterium]|nr:hypothetical protein [Leptospirales bacterium]
MNSYLCLKKGLKRLDFDPICLKFKQFMRLRLTIALLVGISATAGLAAASSEPGKAEIYLVGKDLQTQAQLSATLVKLPLEVRQSQASGQAAEAPPAIPGLERAVLNDSHQVAIGASCSRIANTAYPSQSIRACYLQSGRAFEASQMLSAPSQGIAVPTEPEYSALDGAGGPYSPQKADQASLLDLQVTAFNYIPASGIASGQQRAESSAIRFDPGSSPAGSVAAVALNAAEPLLAIPGHSRRTAGLPHQAGNNRSAAIWTRPLWPRRHALSAGSPLWRRSTVQNTL